MLPFWAAKSFPVAALPGEKQQNPHGPDRVRRNVDSVECKKLSTGLGDGACSTLKALQPNDMPLAPSLSLSLLPPLAPSVFCPSIQVFTLAGGFSALSLPSSSIQVLQLTKPPFIAAQRQLCTSLCHACFPVSLMFWQSADRRASTFPPRPSSPPSDCNNVSKCSSAWR